jgi:hypothetical protein
MLQLKPARLMQKFLVKHLFIIPELTARKKRINAGKLWPWESNKVCHKHTKTTKA